MGIHSTLLAPAARRVKLDRAQDHQIAVQSVSACRHDLDRTSCRSLGRGGQEFMRSSGATMREGLRASESQSLGKWPVLVEKSS